MKTKLVYILVCAPDKYYIEKALISAFSARYHNPYAHIALIIDRPTNELLVGRRAELLNYLTERIIVEVPKECNTVQASRWLKTNVRNLIDGDFLFIDCDTIVVSSLEEVDGFSCQICATLDCHRYVSSYNQDEKDKLINNGNKCGWNFTNVDYYRSSGVLYVKDTQQTHDFYRLWHENYKHSSSCGVNCDQISFEKATQDLPVVSDMAGVWNTIMFARPSFVDDAKIIHFTALDNNSFLFSNRILKYISENGLTDYIKTYILNPAESYVPYLKRYYCGLTFFNTCCRLAKGVKNYGENIDFEYNDLVIHSRIGGFIKCCFRRKYYLLGTIIWMTYIKLTGKYNPLASYYKIEDEINL